MTAFHPAPKPVPKVKAPKPLKGKNVKRAADAFARSYHSSERVEFVKALPCIVPGCRIRPSENAHIRTDGLSRKGPYVEVVPACSGHHRTRADSMHALSFAEFEAEHLVDLAALAADTERIWRRHIGHHGGAHA